MTPLSALPLLSNQRSRHVDSYRRRRPPWGRSVLSWRRSCTEARTKRRRRRRRRRRTGGGWRHVRSRGSRSVSSASAWWCPWSLDRGMAPLSVATIIDRGGGGAFNQWADAPHPFQHSFGSCLAHCALCPHASHIPCVSVASYRSTGGTSWTHEQQIPRVFSCNLHPWPTY